jgi:hypothetical protein
MTDYALMIVQILSDVSYIRGGFDHTFEIRRNAVAGWHARVGRDNWAYWGDGPTVAHAIEALAADVAQTRRDVEADEAAELADDGRETLADVERDTLPGMPASREVA